jgi:hypothetical protein
MFLNFLSTVLMPRKGNNSYKDVFKRLNRDILEKRAAKWALQYPNVSKIVLYGIPLQYCAESNFIIHFKFEAKEDAEKSGFLVFEWLSSGLTQIHGSLLDQINVRPVWYSVKQSEHRHR